MDKRFRSLQSPPVSCFQVFDFRFWSPSWWCWHQDTCGPLFICFSRRENWVKCFGPVPWFEAFDFTDYPESILTTRIVFFNLANKTDNLKSILSIVEVTAILLGSTAACQRSSSAMNRITLEKHETRNVARPAGCFYHKWQHWGVKSQRSNKHLGEQWKKQEKLQLQLRPTQAVPKKEMTTSRRPNWHSFLLSSLMMTHECKST